MIPEKDIKRHMKKEKKKERVKKCNVDHRLDDLPDEEKEVSTELLCTSDGTF